MMILLKELNDNVNTLCTSSTLKSTSSASRAISVVAERLVVVVMLKNCVGTALLQSVVVA